MKLRDATPADAARLDELLTKLIHDEAQYDSNLNGSYVVTDNYLDRIGLEGHKLLLIEGEGEIVAFLYLYEKLSFKETKKYMAMDLWEH